ncbi:uncharacterized protein LOC134807971 [Pan troglodytes]|uniref:uncharacterized protein LOC134807971 n=1 Tax=Pan troglodytes TaxID=9598 RepID=UPI0030138840
MRYPLSAAATRLAQRARRAGLGALRPQKAAGRPVHLLPGLGAAGCCAGHRQGPTSQRGRRRHKEVADVTKRSLPSHRLHREVTSFTPTSQRGRFLHTDFTKRSLPSHRLHKEFASARAGLSSKGVGRAGAGSPRGGDRSEPALLQPRGLSFAPPIGRASGAAEAWLAGPSRMHGAERALACVEPRQERSNWYRGGFAFSGMHCPLSRSSASEQECQKVACAEAGEWESATDCLFLPAGQSLIQPWGRKTPGCNHAPHHLSRS